MNRITLTFDADSRQIDNILESISNFANKHAGIDIEVYHRLIELNYGTHFNIIQKGVVVEDDSKYWNNDPYSGMRGTEEMDKAISAKIQELVVKSTLVIEL
jgi:hypothetical protein